MVIFIFYFAQVNFAFTQESLTEDEFFGENIVNNLVAFLGIPKNKVRVMEIVSAAGSSTRRRRRRTAESSLTTITVSVYTPPSVLILTVLIPALVIVELLKLKTKIAALTKLTLF